MKTTMQELWEDIISDKENIDQKTYVILRKKIYPLIEKENQNKKQECIEFSKYIRNGKDHFNNGSSTEMVYDEWIEKYKKQQE